MSFSLPSVHMTYIDQYLAPVTDRHSLHIPRGVISKFKPPHLTTSHGMENLRKTEVIMCVGEPSALNACQGWACIVSAGCRTFYKQGVTRSPIKSRRKTTSHSVIGAPWYICVYGLIHLFLQMDSHPHPPFIFLNHGWEWLLLTHNGYCWELYCREKNNSLLQFDMFQSMKHRVAHRYQPFCCMQFAHVTYDHELSWFELSPESDCYNWGPICAIWKLQ